MKQWAENKSNRKPVFGPPGNGDDRTQTGVLLETIGEFEPIQVEGKAG